MRPYSPLRSYVDHGYVLGSFVITFGRLVIALITCANIATNYANTKYHAITAIVVIMGLDYLDGSLFRKSQLAHVKEWRMGRRIVDSVADRAVIQIVCIPLLITDQTFGWLYAVICAREAALTIYLCRFFKLGFLVYPGPIARAACVSVGLTVIGFLILGLSAITVILGLGMIAMSFLSLHEYSKTLSLYLGGSVEMTGNVDLRL